MCDKLQTSKDGSVDLCHGRLVEYSAPHRSVYSNNSISGSSSSGSNGNRKQRKYNGKDNHCTDSDLSPKSRNKERGYGSHRDRDKERGYGSHRDRDRQVGSAQGQRWPKHDRQDSRKNKESSSGDFSEVGKRKPPLLHLITYSTLLWPLLRGTIQEGGACLLSLGTGGGTLVIPITKRNFFKQRDYNIHSEDPDKLVEWEYIQQVRLFCHEIPSCPICLYPPRAAKITRCGHVYCWSCLLHYLSLGEKKWSKCPICNESIYRQDIKSVAALSSPQYKVGDKISMKLMVKGKGSTQVFASADWDGKDHAMLTVEDSCVNQFVKLVSATPSQVLSEIISPERTALQAQLAQLDAGEASEKCFIEVALKDLEMRESELLKAQAVHSEVEQIISESLVSLTTPQPIPSPATSSSWTAFSGQYFEGGYEHPFLDLCGERDSTDSSQSQEEYGDAGEKNEVEGTTQPLSGAVEMGENEERESSVESSPNSLGSPRSFTSDGSNNGDPLPSQTRRGNLVYFYQASDGQHFYMHPVNIKCLAKEYGGLEYCPCEVTATVVEIEQLTMSEELRGRYKSLSHLPLTCELALCELDLKPPTVSLDALEHFSVEIHKRRQKRVKKKRDERRREKRAEAKTSYLEPTYRVPSALELTPEKFHDFLSFTSSPSLLDAGSPETATKTNPLEIKGGSSSEGTPPPPSFAQALRCKSSTWPVKVSPKGMVGQQHSDADMPTREEEETAVPAFQDAFNEAFQTASMSINKATEGKPGSKTAKKGRKKLVLFSTGGSRGYN